MSYISGLFQSAKLRAIDPSTLPPAARPSFPDLHPLIEATNLNRYEALTCRCPSTRGLPFETVIFNAARLPRVHTYLRLPSHSTVLVESIFGGRSSLSTVKSFPVFLKIPTLLSSTLLDLRASKWSCFPILALAVTHRNTVHFPQT